ncbi:MAG: L,D-transpeptidase family protein [Bdellovibrionaceae bacterium]|nr:L,D-transpeptidase family protein [Pseudobdellovibrionaceae bacterium]
MSSIWKTVPRALMIASLLASPQVGLASGQMVMDLVTNNSFLKLSGLVLETSKMKQLYEATGGQPLWVQHGRLTELGQALPAVLKTADRHGLNPRDYWTPLLESLFQQPGGNTWISLELAATEALLHYATDLHAGRLEPTLIDDDIKFTKKTLEISRLAEILQKNGQALAVNLDSLAPQEKMYSELRKHLMQLRQYQSINAIPELVAPDKNLSPGDRHPIIPKLKQKLRLLGYEITDISDLYDGDLEMAIMFYQTDNGLPFGSTLLPKGNFWRHIGVGIGQRLKQIELSMEKLRWLPNRLESRHVFTNLAFQRFRLMENGQPVLQMRTINGQPHRRTPTMRDRITTVEFNPTWTVPYSIALKDKLPLIQQDINYLYRARLTVFDSNTWQPMDPYLIDWRNVTEKNMNFYLQQDAGPQNALGLFKFHLTNPWAIYYHDTSDPHLFQESNRELSSGCIRLERPMELAKYLLASDPKWSSESQIRAVLAKSQSSSFTSQIKVSVKQPIPIYTLYLTAEVTPEGGLGFTADGYGQDARLLRMLNARPAKGAGAGDSSITGQLTVRGTPGRGQAVAKVTAIRCDRSRRFACDDAINFDLNKATTLPAGSYIVGFENSLHAGWVQVSGGGSTTLDLVQVSLPAGAQAGSNIKVFRDLSHKTEQRKFLWAIYNLGRHPMGLATYDFGDLYSATSNKRDIMSRISADYCVSNANSLKGLSKEGRDTCAVILNAKNFTQLAGNYEFKTDSSVIEKFVTAPGDWIRIQHKRHLVSTPLEAQDFISVFPGAYRAMADGQKSSSAFTAGQVQENY